MKVSKCKLMFFVYILGQGGAERVILNILNNIDFKKYDVYLTLGVRDGNDYLSFLKTIDKIKLNYLDIPLGNNDLAIKKLSEYLEKFDIDILFTEAHFTNTLAYHAKRISNNKKVKLIFREATARSLTERVTVKVFLKTFLHYNFGARKIIAISDGVKQDLVKKYGVISKKIITIHNPIDIDDVIKKSKKKIDDKEFLSIKKKKIINVARLAPAKNQTVLLDAFSRILEKRNDVALVFLGRGNLEQELKQYCKSNNIDDVYFLGFKENPYQYIKNSDVFVLSSKSEGFGNVITESMAIGTPIVSTDCQSGPREILKNNQYGMLVEVGNDLELSNAILEILDNDKKRNKFIHDAKKEVQNYRIQKIIKEYEKVIDEVYRG